MGFSEGGRGGFFRGGNPNFQAPGAGRFGPEETQGGFPPGPPGGGRGFGDTGGPGRGGFGDAGMVMPMGRGGGGGFGDPGAGALPGAPGPGFPMRGRGAMRGAGPMRGAFMRGGRFGRGRGREDMGFQGMPSQAAAAQQACLGKFGIVLYTRE